MLKIGVTGGIGSGKTTICLIFELLGIPVFYADTAAKKAMANDPVLIEEISRTFGKNSYFEDGKLNNKYLASIVFKEDEALKKLNQLVHPAVFRAFDKWVKLLPQNTPYCLKEAALLVESLSYQLCDKNILVVSPLEQRIANVMKRDNVDSAQVLARINKQLSDEEKSKFMDYFIQNDGKQSLIEQVMNLHQIFITLK